MSLICHIITAVVAQEGTWTEKDAPGGQACAVVLTVHDVAVPGPPVPIACICRCGWLTVRRSWM
jgi:hypothetical protein